MNPDPIIYSVCFSCCLLQDYHFFPTAVRHLGWDKRQAACNGGRTVVKGRTLDHGPPPVGSVNVAGCSPYTEVALLFPQSQVLGFHAFPKKYSCYLLKQILSLPHLIIQWWTLKLSAGWKITCFSKYKISISAAFASPSVSHPWPRQPPAIQTLTVIMQWSEKERRTGGKFISSLWDVYCFFCSQLSKVSVVLRDIL